MKAVNTDILRRIDGYIEKNKNEILNSLLKLVQIPSVQSLPQKDAPFGIECKKILEETKKLYESCGFKTVISPDKKYALSFFGKGDKTIGLFAHGDVVPADDGWKICKPFEPIVKEGHIFGRGSNDDKSGIVQSLYAAKMIRDLEFPFKSRLTMMTGSNEETGMADIISFAQNEKMPEASLVLDGEYPYYGGEKSSIKLDITSKRQLKIIKKIHGGKAYNIVLGEVSAELEFSEALFDELKELLKNKSVFELKRENDSLFVTAKGKSGHTANVDKTQNAMILLADMLIKCENIPTFDKDILKEISRYIGNGYGIGFAIEHNDKDFGKLICSNGIVRTYNRRLILGFDIRAGISFDTEDIKKQILAVAGNNWNVEFKRISKGYLIDNSLSCAKVISEVYGQITGDLKKEPPLTSGGTYTRLLENSYSIGTVDYCNADAVDLPAGHGGVHQPDEKISIKGFLGALKILVCMLLEIDNLLNQSENKNT